LLPTDPSEAGKSWWWVRLVFSRVEDSGVNLGSTGISNATVVMSVLSCLAPSKVIGVWTFVVTPQQQQTTIPSDSPSQRVLFMTVGRRTWHHTGSRTGSRHGRRRVVLLVGGPPLCSFSGGNENSFVTSRDIRAYETQSIETRPLVFLFKPALC
jgi:hypothetical protein